MSKQTSIDDALAEYAQPYDGKPAPARAFKVRERGSAQGRKATKR